jgi:alkylation response protein AidB-like acyl-CoA dehydrogenase
MLYSEEQEAFRRNMRRFVEKEITPYLPEWEKAQMSPREIYKKLGDLGYLGIIFPPEYGGAGGDFKTVLIFIEELCRCGGLGLPLSITAHAYMIAPYIYHLGTEEQRQKYLVPAIKGERILAFALSEPNYGSDAAGIQTSARKEGDYYRVNGSKIFITNGVQADSVVLICRTSPGKQYNGLSLLIVDKDTPGFSVGRKLNKLGHLSSDTAELVFDNCLVPQENLLGPEGTGFIRMAQEIQYERLTLAVLAIGGAQVAFEWAFKYAGERTQFGKKLSEFQVIRHKLADMATEIEIIRAYCYHVAEMLEKGIDCVKEISMLKRFSSEAALKIVSESLQIHGGYGYITEFPIERMFRDIRMYSIGGGTSEIQKEIIAKRIGL